MSPGDANARHIARCMIANALIANAGSRQGAAAKAANRSERHPDPDHKRFWREVHDLLRSGQDIPAEHRGTFKSIPNPHAVHYVRVNAFASGGAVGHVYDDGEKITKEEARYRLGTERRRCGLCSMFVRDDGEHGDGRCTLVEGSISPHGTCKYFERK